MADMNWKTWCLMLVIGVGLMFEVFKHMPAGTTSNLFDRENFSFGLTAAKPYSVKTKSSAQKKKSDISKSHPLPALTAEQLKAFAAATSTATPGQTDFAHKEKGGEGEAKKPDDKVAKNPDDYEIFIDPKTGKKYRRKKKKKPEEKQEELAKKPEVKEEKKSAEEPPAAIQTAIVNSPQAPPPAEKEAPVDFEEWVRRLLARPDAKLTREFIQQYQQGKIGADIFYKVARIMAADPRVEMKTLGAMCAGSTPSLLSFQMLAGLQKTENSGTPLRTAVDGYLNAYSNLENLGYLQRVLSGNDSYGIVLAAHYVEISANRYLQQPADTGTPGPKAQDVVALNGPKFQQFLAVLQPLTKSHDANVNQQANQTYSTLQRLLGTAPAATTTPPATTAGNQQPAGDQLVTTLQGQ